MAIPDPEPDVFDPNLAPVVFGDVAMAEAWVLSYRSPSASEIDYAA